MIDTTATSQKQNALVERIRRLSKSKLFDRRVSDPGAWETIAWWELRRIPYNLLVGATGLISLALCVITGLLCEHFLGDPIGIPDPPFFALLGIAAYGVMANVCYTGGWAAEILVQKVWPDKGNDFGTILFFLGLIFPSC